jgi:hypothetical protein
MVRPLPSAHDHESVCAFADNGLSNGDTITARMQDTRWAPEVLDLIGCNSEGPAGLTLTPLPTPGELEQLLLTGLSDGSVAVWDAANGQKRCEDERPREDITQSIVCLACLPCLVKRSLLLSEH